MENKLSSFKILKRLMDVFVKGDLIRIKSSGEVFIYDSSTGGANFSSYLNVNVAGKVIEYGRSLHVDEVEKVNSRGVVIDDFKKHEKN